MSNVSNVILTVSLDVDITPIQEYLKSMDRHEQQLTRAVDPNNYKSLEVDIYVGGFNYLPKKELIKAFKNIDLEYHDLAHLSIYDQEDNLTFVVRNPGCNGIHRIDI